MKSIFNFIVRPKTNRSTSSKIIEGKELLLNTELQNHNYVSRQGIVLSKPLLGNTNIKKVDEVILHHNVFRRFYDVRGNEKIAKAISKKINTLLNRIKYMLISQVMNGKQKKGFVL